MVGSVNQLVTGNVGGALQLWIVDHTHSPPSISLTKSMEVDGGIFSAAFDSKMELVSVSYISFAFNCTTCSVTVTCTLNKNDLIFPCRVWLALHLAQCGTSTGLT